MKVANPLSSSALVALATLVSVSTSRAEGPPESGAGWLQVRTGVTFADAATIDSFIGLEGDGDPAMVFGVGAHWRTSRLDFGAIFESFASWSFSGVSREQRVGAQFRAAALLRWRYIEDTWGSLYLALTPGLVAFDHTAPMRFQVAQSIGASDRTVDEHTIGFSFGFDFGALIYLTEEVALALHLDVITSNTALATEGGDVDLGMVRGLFAVGLEWRM